jgi:hypothetical protein
MINTASTLVQPYTIILCVVKNNEYDEIHLDKEKNQTFQPFLERERERERERELCCLSAISSHCSFNLTSCLDVNKNFLPS